MAENSKIEWTDHTFNPWTGCTKVSPACDHCYAEQWSRRAGDKVGKWGPGMPRVRTTAVNWRQPLKWNSQARAEGRRFRVFCASLADVFDNEVDPAWRFDLFDLIDVTPHLDWLLLTKRVGNVVDMLPGRYFGRLPGNVWLGATICNQPEADRDIPKLLNVPAAKRFLSIEPLLGPVNLRPINEDREVNEVDCLKPDRWEQAIAAWRDSGDNWVEDFEDWFGVTLSDAPTGHMHPGIDWVIVGGESGPGARPMHPDWARSLRDQCAEAGVPFLFKQWGEFAEHDAGKPLRLVDAYGEEAENILANIGDPTSFVHVDGRHWAQVDDVPLGVRARLMLRVGKKSAGRLLDGRTWDGVPS